MNLFNRACSFFLAGAQNGEESKGLLFFGTFYQLSIKLGRVPSACSRYSTVYADFPLTPRSRV
jgi:hypothetical protein